MSRWHSCNVFQTSPTGRQLWQFYVGGGSLKLAHQEKKLPTEALTTRLVAKDWQTLYKRKLNVACLPPDKLFLRAIQLPATDATEARSMLDLQLEKLSPIPVLQAVWTFDLLPATGASPLRTAIVVVAPRDYVESILGELEGQGYMADRLEIPFVDELLATKITGNGVWIYPGIGADKLACLVAWWYGGILQSVALLHLPPEPESGRYLRLQLAQMAWAGELEGWLSAPPHWHLVAAPEVAVHWEPWLREEGHALELAAPTSPAEIAALTARRAAVAVPVPGSGLLPPEFAVRYRQQFIDRIWMRALGALVVMVFVGTMGYLGYLQVVRYQVGRMEKNYASKSAAYQSALKIKAEVQVLQDQVDLQFLALECWKAVSTLLPPELTLQGVNFQRGHAVSVFGSGPAEGSPSASDYNEALSKYTYKDDPLFTKVGPPDLRIQQGQGLRWTLNAELKRNVTD